MAEKEAKTEEVVEEVPALTKEGKVYPDVHAGTLVRVHERIVETNPKGEEKTRVQIFEGMVIQRKHGKGISATITVRKVSKGFGVEKIFPLSSPSIEKVEVIRRYKVRRTKIGFIRDSFKRLKEIKPSK